MTLYTKFTNIRALIFAAESAIISLEVDCMRKWLCMLLALSVLLCVSAQAEEALFDMPCPEGWTIDTESYTAENTPDSVWMCEYRRSDDSCINVYRDYVSEWAGVTLSQNDPETAQQYKEELDSIFSVKALLLQSVTAQSGNIFWVYAVADEYGLYINALTLVNGWEVSAAMETKQTIQTEDVAILTEMLSGFRLRGDPEDWEKPEIVVEGSYTL